MAKLKLLDQVSKKHPYPVAEKERIMREILDPEEETLNEYQLYENDYSPSDFISLYENDDSPSDFIFLPSPSTSSPSTSSKRKRDSGDGNPISKQKRMLSSCTVVVKKGSVFC